MYVNNNIIYFLLKNVIYGNIALLIYFYQYDNIN